jgi:hypothetical protein
VHAQAREGAWCLARSARDVTAPTEGYDNVGESHA